MGNVLKLIERSEANILASVKVLLNWHKMRGVLTYKRINTGPVVRGGQRGTKKYFSKNESAGFPDLILFLKAREIAPALGIFIPPRTLLWECKAPRGKLSEGQIEFQNELRKVGHDIEVIRSVDDAVASLKREGICLDEKIIPGGG